MKKYINILASAAVAVLALSCVKEEAKVAKAVLGDVSIMNFTATNPEPQSLTVVSDGPWHTTAPAWITVTPETGDGETVVTVTAAENTDAEGLLEPRKDTVYLSGNKLSSRHMIIVSQAGDAYRSAEHLTVAQIAALSDGKSFVLDEATVVAVTKAGYVITDGTVNVYVKASSEVALGDKVSLKGIKGTVNGVPVVATVDGCSVKESGTAEYPEPIDLNAQIATYAATSMEYVKASGLVSGGMLIVTVDETEYAIKQVDATDAADLAALNGHKATVTGYSYGILGAKMFAVLATDVKDDGLDQVIYFEDNFEWMETWTSVAEAGDDIKNNVVDTDHAPNVFGNAESFADFISAFQTKGYGYVWGWKGQDWSNGDPDNGNKRTLYLQRNYLKFGKSKYSSGIILPALSAIEGTDDILLSFDWCSCMTGTGLPDLTTLAVVVADGGTFEENGTTTSDEIKSAQPIDDAGKTKLEWQHVEIRINGATSATRITIRPFNADPDVTNSARHQNRWYLDNVKVVPADGGSAGAPAVKVGDMLWEEWWQGGAADQKASEYCASVDKTTASFGDAAITYTETGSTLLKADGLVYYNTAATAATDPQKQMNLLIAKNNGTLKAAGIPCKGVKTATLTYRSNSKLEGNHKVSTSTTGVTIGDLSATSVPKLDLETKNTYTITCLITVEAGVETLDLTITNISTSANIRVDGFELKVTEVQ